MLLTQHPDLLWQQLYNRLQWERDEGVVRALQAELARRTAIGASPWLRTRTPFRESAVLVRTLTGHKGSVEACGFSPDGRWIISGSYDHTVKVWDAANGAEIRTLTGHTGWVYACCFNPDGRSIISGSDDHTVKVWDGATGAEIRTMTGHTQLGEGLWFQSRRAMDRFSRRRQDGESVELCHRCDRPHHDWPHRLGVCL